MEPLTQDQRDALATFEILTIMRRYVDIDALPFDVRCNLSNDVLAVVKSVAV